MSDYIERDVTLVVSGKTAKFNENVYIFKGDKDIQLNIEIIDTNMKYSRTNPNGNVLLPLPSNCYAKVGLLKPKGDQIIRERVPIIDNKVAFVIDESICDELEEIGIHKIQIQIWATNEETSPRWTLPSAAELEVLKPDINFQENQENQSNVSVAKVGVAKTNVTGLAQRPILNAEGLYNKKAWIDNEVITKEDLNVIEEGVYNNSSQLNNIANEKVDKVDGKGLSTNDYTTSEKQKLEGLSNYVHPSTHDASIINQDSTHRFVTDEEKSKWNSATGVTQEQIDSAVTSYLNANPVTGGLTTTAKDLLITILRNAMYTTNQSANITALESALASSESGGDTPVVTTYTITNNLTNCVNSNTDTTVAENSSYVTTITPSDGYTLTDASVNITMGGIDITSTAYSNGTINIASVTGDVVITISTMQIPQTIYYTITNNLTNCTSNNNKTNTQENTSYTATISPSSGYTLTDASISVTMGGVDVTSTVYNNGVINISSVTGNVVITISAVKIALSVNEISPSYLTVKNRRTININNPDAMLTEMPDTISFIAKDVDQYWASGLKVGLNVRDNAYTQTGINISYTNKSLTVDGIIYAVITITKADYTTAYNTYKGYIDNDGKIAYNLNSITFGNSDNKFNENYLPKIVDNSVDKNVISSLTW